MKNKKDFKEDLYLDSWNVWE